METIWADMYEAPRARRSTHGSRLAGRPRVSVVMRIVAVGALFALMLLSGCDPCSGVLGCSASNDSPYLAADGQIVDAGTGVGVDGIRVDVIRRSGVVVAQDSLSVVTANGGHWRVEFTTQSSGSLEADAVVSAPGGVPYRVRGVQLATSRRGGEGNLIPRWVERPYFGNAAELFVRGTPDQRLAQVVVEFRRTGGLELKGVSVNNGLVRTSTDFAGRAPLFSAEGNSVYTDGLGAVVGDLIVRRSATDSSVVKGLSVSSTHLYHAPTGIIRLGVGPSLAYQGEFYSRATGKRLPGVEVLFERLDGVGTAGTTFSTTTDVNGRFSFPLRPLASGVVRGRLIFRAPIPSTPETLLVKLPTFDSDEGRFYGVIGAGAYLPYYGIVVAGSGVGVDGVAVEVRRVGGIEISPSTFTTLTTDGGIFRLNAAPLALGDVIVDLTIRPPAPLQPYTVSGIRLSTADRQVGDRLFGVYRTDQPPPP